MFFVQSYRVYKHLLHTDARDVILLHKNYNNGGVLMSTGQVWILIVFILYFGAIISMAIRFRKSENLADYFLGGRGLNTWIGALSAQTSDMSGWLLMALPGSIFFFGTGRAWIAIGLLIGTILNWCFVAKRLRRYTIVASNSITLPEFFENRFRDSSHVLKMTACIFFAIFFTVYAASGFLAGGRMLPHIFGVSYPTAVIILAAFVVLYTLIGGLKAISWTDSIQGMMMLAAVFFLPLIVISHMGGWGEITASIDQPGFFNLMSDSDGSTLPPVHVISGLAWGLGYFGMPHILVKLIAINKEKFVHKSAVIAIIWVIIALGSAITVGWVGRAFIPEIGFDGREYVFIEIINRIFLDHGTVILTLLGALFLCGMFAAIKSTADSHLLVGSSAVGDIYKTINKKASDKNLVWFSRCVVFIMAVAASLVALDAYVPAHYNEYGVYVPWALDRATGVMALVSVAWAGFGSAFGPLVLCSLFWKRTNRAGGVAGVVVGGVTVLIWQYASIIDGVTPMVHTSLNHLVPGFSLSLIAIIIASLVTKAPSEEVLKDFDTASKPMQES